MLPPELGRSADGPNCGIPRALRIAGASMPAVLAWGALAVGLFFAFRAIRHALG
jgi:hypothetical protein